MGKQALRACRPAGGMPDAAENPAAGVDNGHSAQQKNAPRFPSS